MSLKLQIVQEIERGQLTATEATKKYGIQCRKTVVEWLRKFGNFDWENQSSLNMPKTPEQKIMELEAHVKLLEKQKALLEQQVNFTDKKAIIFDMLIDIAEKEYNINIRKNSSPEQLNDLKKSKNKTLGFTCSLLGIDRQVYYRKVKRRVLRQSLTEKVIALVMDIRVTMPRIGTRKLYYLLSNELKTLKIGRDKFFNILKINHLLIRPRRSHHITTNSHHRFRKHKNLVENLAIHRPEQVWVSDITYIGKRSKPCYLSLVTDAYSKLIMGYNVATDLNTESSLKALQMALKTRKDKSLSLIHHSDRGIQYCSDEYQKVILKTKNLHCSMTESYDPYQNAVAERVNGILKQEFMIDRYKDQELKIIKLVVKESVEVYNNERPHWSNHMLTPRQMHQQNKIEMKSYKTKNRSNPEATSV